MIYAILVPIISIIAKIFEIITIKPVYGILAIESLVYLKGDWSLSHLCNENNRELPTASVTKAKIDSDNEAVMSIFSIEIRIKHNNVSIKYFSDK